jgi:hypothetical protein
VSALCVLLWSGAARAAAGCPEVGDPATGPLAGGAAVGAAAVPADFGAVPEACGATDLALRARAALLLATTMPDYYGSILGAVTVRGRYRVGERSTVSIAADAINYHYVNNGGLASQGASAGPATVGFHQMFVLGVNTATSLYARLLVPLDTARQTGLETGLELGGAIRARAGSRWVIDGGLALAAPTDVIAGQTHVRLEPVGLAEAWLRLRPWMALCGGANMRLAASPEFDLITLAPRLGARFSMRRRWWMAALFELPVVGSDRTDLVAGLYAGFIPN